MSQARSPLVPRAVHALHYLARSLPRLSLDCFHA